MAWLHAVPKGSEKSRLRFYKEQDEESSYLKLPDLEGADYLIDLLHEAGLVSTSGMGITALTWTEITNWLSAVERDLSVWEKLTVRLLSEQYANEYSLSNDVMRPIPYVHADEVEEVNRTAVASKILAVLRSFKR